MYSVLLDELQQVMYFSVYNINVVRLCFELPSTSIFLLYGLVLLWELAD